MAERLVFSPTLVEKVTSVIRREEEAGRDSCEWEESFEAGIPQRVSGEVVSSDEIVKGLQNRFQTVFLYCIDSTKPVVSTNPSTVIPLPQTEIIFQESQRLRNHRNNGDGNHQRHLEALSQLPPADAALYLRAQAAKRGLLHAQRNDNKVRS